MSSLFTKCYVDELSGVSIFEDIRGGWHVVNPELDILGESRVYLQAYTEQEWPNTTDFHPVPCDLTGASNLKYRVPENSYYGAAFILGSVGQGGQNLTHWGFLRGASRSHGAAIVRYTLRTVLATQNFRRCGSRAEIQAMQKALRPVNLRRRLSARVIFQ